jgi:hypothetical protein
LAMGDLDGDQLSDLVLPDPNISNGIDVFLNATPVFSMSASQTKLTVVGAQQVTDTISIAAHNGFSSPIHFSCQVSGPAPLPTCSLSPTDITAGPNTSTLTVNVPTSAGLLSPASLRIRPAYGLAFPFALLVLSFGTRCSDASKRRLFLCSVATLGLVFSSCGGGNPSSHQTKSYSVVVTAASNTLTKTLQIALTVQ